MLHTSVLVCASGEQSAVIYSTFSLDSSLDFSTSTPNNCSMPALTAEVGDQKSLLAKTSPDQERSSAPQESSTRPAGC